MLAHLPTMMGLFQPGTTRGMFFTTIGSLNTVPLRMLRMVPLGDTHICAQVRHLLSSFVPQPLSPNPDPDLP